MAYELTELLNRCTREDAEFLLSIIDSYVNFTDDKGLRELFSEWRSDQIIPIKLNQKIETEIRYLGSNDFAYMTRKMRGYVPAGVSIDEIVDDLCKLMKVNVPLSQSLEGRLEIFAGNVVDQQFGKLPDERKREILEKMNFEKHHLQEIMDKVINNKEMLLPIILPVLGRTVGPEVLQGLIIAIIAPFVGTEAAKVILAQILAR